MTQLILPWSHAARISIRRSALLTISGADVISTLLSRSGRLTSVTQRAEWRASRRRRGIRQCCFYALVRIYSGVSISLIPFQPWIQPIHVPFLSGFPSAQTRGAMNLDTHHCWGLPVGWELWVPRWSSRCAQSRAAHTPTAHHLHSPHNASHLHRCNAHAL